MSEKPDLVKPGLLAYSIEEEGLDYAVRDYYGRNIICPEDPELEALWKAAYDAMEALHTYTKTNYPRW